VNVPEQLAQGTWHLALTDLVVSGGIVSSDAVSRHVDIQLLGVQLKDNYAATAQQDTVVVASFARNATSMTMTRDITASTFGIPLADFGQLRGRQVTVVLRDGDGAIHPNSGISHWRAVLAFYLLDD
jgi:hypothetical protein